MNNVFSILRDIVDSGHLADMSGTEAKAVLAFLYYSNFDGSNAYPAMASIAEKIGAASSHWARRAVHSLEARTILATTNDSKGRNTKTRCLQSPTKPPSNRSTKCTSSTGTESEPVQKMRANRYSF